MSGIIQRIAEELAVNSNQVTAAVQLLDEGATVPFIARYRKEVTGSLDDSQLRTLNERLTYLRELDDRRATVLKSIDEQRKLTPQLKQQILSAETKTRLEDLYLPYKPKRRTKAQIAREAGLEPLAQRRELLCSERRIRCSPVSSRSPRRRATRRLPGCRRRSPARPGTAVAWPQTWHPPCPW